MFEFSTYEQSHFFIDSSRRTRRDEGAKIGSSVPKEEPLIPKEKVTFAPSSLRVLRDELRRDTEQYNLFLQKRKYV